MFAFYHNILLHTYVAVATECPPGMVYQQCGSLCPQTCDNTEATICPSGCAEGCFCPDGLVAHDGNCIEPLTCPGIIIIDMICVHIII